MSTETQTDIEIFYEFLGRQLADGRKKLTPEESVQLFRAWQRDVERLRAELQPALEQSARGESEPLDAEALKKKIRDRLAEQGITD